MFLQVLGAFDRESFKLLVHFCSIKTIYLYKNSKINIEIANMYV